MSIGLLKKVFLVFLTKSLICNDSFFEKVLDNALITCYNRV